MESKILISLRMEVKLGHTGLLTEPQAQEEHALSVGRCALTRKPAELVILPKFSPRPCFPMRQEGKQLGNRFQIL